MSLVHNRSAGFFATKAIDGMPSVNASYLLMGQRTSHFMFRMMGRQKYYESTSDPDEVRKQFIRSAQMHILNLARSADQILIVVEAFRSWYDAPNGAVSLPARGDVTIGNHVVYLSGFADDGEIFRFANSWGRSWGDRGYGTLTFEYLTKHLVEAFTQRSARYGPASWRIANPEPPNVDEYRRRLRLYAPRQRVRQRRPRGENWVVELFETPSPATGWPVRGVEVLTGFGLRMAWAFLRYQPADGGDILQIPELFVWPTFRRMGIGQMLEEIAREQAAAWGCREIHLMMNEADAVLNPPNSPRSRARLFGKALGYEWRWRTEVAPRRPATGVKRVAT